MSKHSFASGLLRRAASLVSAPAAFRPGTTLPGLHAPFASAPATGTVGARALPAKALRRSLRLSAIEGMAAEVVTAFAGGAVLTGWALYLGLSPLGVGLLSALPFLSQALQIPSAYLSEALGNRKVCIVAVAASRQALLPLVALPFLPLSQGGKQAVLLTVAGAAALLGVVGNHAWVSWMGALVPRRIRGRYFGRRTALCTLAGTVASLIAGLVLDGAGRTGQTAWALAGLALFACAAGVVTTLLMVRQHAPESKSCPRLTIAAALAPLRDPGARALLAYQLAWNGAIGISGAYFALHMLENLKMGFTLIALHGASVAVVRILMGPVWGRMLDRVGARPVLIFCSCGISIIPLYWLWATEGFLWPIALDVVVSAGLWSGHALAVFQLPLAVAPRESRSFYLASFAMAGGVAYAVSTFVGGTLAQLLPARFFVLGQPAVSLHVLFALSSLLRAVASLLALRITEPGARSVEELTRVLGAEVFSGRIAALLVRR
ncbi:MAG: MFS transporter [Myxococcota bacterium]